MYNFGLFGWIGNEIADHGNIRKWMWSEKVEVPKMKKWTSRREIWKQTKNKDGQKGPDFSVSEKIKTEKKTILMNEKWWGNCK